MRRMEASKGVSPRVRDPIGAEKMEGENMLDERLGDLFQPDVVLPKQFFSTFRHKTRLKGEMRLVVAVLEDAIDCFRKNILARTGKRRRLFTDAENWVLSDDRTDLFSFINVCEILGLDPEYLREGLMALKERVLSGSLPADEPRGFLRADDEELDDDADGEELYRRASGG